VSLERVGLAAHFIFEPGNALDRIDGLSRGLQTFRDRLKTVKRGGKNVAEGLGMIRRGLIPLAAAGGLGAVFAAKEAVAFDRAIAKTGAVLGTAKFAERKEELRELAETLALDPSIGKRPREIAESITVLARAGVSTADEMKSVLVPALELAGVEAIKSEKAIQILLGALSMFGIARSEARKAGDSLSRVSDSVQTNIEGISTSLRFAGPAAAALGMGLHETTASIGAMADFKVPPSIIGTSFGQMLTALAKPKKRKQIEAFTGSITALHGGLIPLPDIIDRLNAAMEGMTTPDKVGRLTDIFNVRGARAAVFLMLAGGDRLRQLIDVSRNGLGSLAEKARITSTSLGGMFDSIKAGMGVVGIEMFEKFELRDEALKLRTFVLEIGAALIALRRSGGERGPVLDIGISRDAVVMAEALRKGVERAVESFDWFKGEVADFLETADPFHQKVVGWGVAFALLSPIIGAVGLALGSVLLMTGGVVRLLYGLGQVLWVVVPGFIAVGNSAVTAVTSMALMRAPIGYLLGAIPALASSVLLFVRSMGALGFAQAVLTVGITGLVGALRAAAIATAAALGPFGLFVAAMTAAYFAGQALADMIDRGTRAMIKQAIASQSYYRTASGELKKQKTVFLETKAARDAYLKSMGKEKTATEAATAEGRKLQEMLSQLGVAANDAAAGHLNLADAIFGVANAEAQVAGSDGFVSSPFVAPQGGDVMTFGDPEMGMKSLKRTEIRNKLNNPSLLDRLDESESRTRRGRGGRGGGCVNVSTTVQLDGKQLSKAVARADLDLQERGGADVTPWSRQMVQDNGLSARSS